VLVFSPRVAISRTVSFRGNPGTIERDTVDLTKVLENHPNVELLKEKLKTTKSWLKSDTKFTEEELEKKGWSKAYDLTVWDEYPTTNFSMKGLVLQNITFGWLGDAGGPTKETTKHAAQIRKAFE